MRQGLGGEPVARDREGLPGLSDAREARAGAKGIDPIGHRQPGIAQAQWPELGHDRRLGIVRQELRGAS